MPQIYDAILRRNIKKRHAQYVKHLKGSATQSKTVGCIFEEMLLFPVNLLTPGHLLPVEHIPAPVHFT